MISVNEAQSIILRETGRLGTERVDLTEMIGRVLAEDIIADMDLPPFDRSQMDGFAVRTEDVKSAPVKLEIAGESVAGKSWQQTLRSGQAVRIMTGAAVPSGADSVQKVELTDETEDGKHILIREPTRIQQNIVTRAEEISKGDLVFEAGHLVSEHMIAALASFGYQQVSVAKRPLVAILATGSEIVGIGDKPGPDQIRNSNSWSLRAFALPFAEVRLQAGVSDDLNEIKRAISRAISGCDVLIISGGVSVGDYDFTKPALREIGAEIFFEKISLKPGKPTVFAKKDRTLIFGLPGNPVSAAVTFYVFVRTALLLLQNARQASLPAGRARLTHPIKGARGRDSLLPVQLTTAADARLDIETLKFSGSSNFIRFAGANALVLIPADQYLHKGEIANIFYLK